MLSLHSSPLPPAASPTRREWLRVGGLSLAGLSLPAVLRADPRPAAAAPALATQLGAATFGKAKNVIFLWLQGGPPQHETFDPKPDAPAEIRGPFKPVRTTVPGTHFCELLPRTAAVAHRLAVVRSMHTDDDNHDVSGYWLLTGYPYGPGSARQIKPNDWPYFGSVLKMVKPSEALPALTSVWIPDVMRLNDNVTPAGQTAGFLGKQWEPERFVGDPGTPDYRIEGVSLPPDVPAARFNDRHDLLASLDRHRAGRPEAWDRLTQHAFDLVTSGKARAAFDLRKEPAAVRDRYGRHTWGQTVLLARRLIEAGVRLVHVNWPREGGDAAVDNPMWDTHAGNADRLQDCLCPQFDITFPALLDDLAQRGLLDETLVVAVGEFGRTPRINAQGGRDHWGRVFSLALAGAGVAGGAVLGASDKTGAVPAADPVRPHDLTATIFHLLGVDPGGMFRDKSDRPHPITKGEPLHRVLGPRPPVPLVEPGGDPAFVPPYDDRKLLDTAFRAGRLVPCAPPSRDKGWRASPLWDAARGDAFSAKAVGGKEPHVALGFGLADGTAPPAIPAGARVLLGQGIRNGRGGQYTFTVRASGGGTSAAYFDAAFAKHFTCRLVIFRFADVTLNPEKVQELAAAEFRPAFGDAKAFTLRAFFGPATPGTNFSIGNGLGVAVVVTKTAAGDLPADAKGPHRAFVRLDAATLAFDPRPRDEAVTV